MLYDFYLLSCYFSPEMALMYEEEVLRRYDQCTISEAVRKGWIALHGPRGLSAKKESQPYFQITPRGICAIEHAEI